MVVTIADKLSRFYDHLPFGVLVLEDETPLYWNPAYATLVRITADDGGPGENSSEGHQHFLTEYQRRFRNDSSRTVRLVPEDESEPIEVFDLFITEFELHQMRLSCVSLLPQAERQRFAQTRAREDFIFGRMRVNVRTGMARYGGTIVQFSSTEFRLFAFLCQNADRVFSKEELLRNVWQQTALNTRTVDMCVSRIRRKLQAAGCTRELVHTRYGQGFVLLRDWED